MPALVAFNRRWRIASDDLLVPAVAELIIRIVWFVAFVVVHEHYSTPLTSCDHGDLLRGYLLGVVVILALGMVIDGLTIHQTTRGAILDTHARRHVSTCLYIRVVLFLPELVWNVLGSVWVYDDSITCRDDAEHVVGAVKAAVSASWLMMGIIIIGTMIIFDPLGHHDVESSLSESSQIELWENRMKTWFCCLGGDDDSRAAFTDIAQLLASLFPSNLDLVASDIAAGLVLLKLRQEEEKIRRRRIGKDGGRKCEDKDEGTNRNEGQMSQTEDTNHSNEGQNDEGGNGGVGRGHGSADCRVSEGDNVENKGDNVVNEGDIGLREGDNDLREGGNGLREGGNGLGEGGNGLGEGGNDEGERPDWMTLPYATNMMRYSLAIYGWPLYLWSNICTGVCRLASGDTGCCSYGGKHHDLILNDNMCRCNDSALRKQTRLCDDDIIFVDFHDSLYQVPFMICLDHTSKSIVISIRGTMSLRDVLTDLVAEREVIAVSADEPSICAHRGMLQAARHIYRVMTDRRLLDMATHLRPDYNIVTTGHSLGAGVAILLSMLLRPYYPAIRCVSFSPPGGLVVKPTAGHMMNIMSVVIGKDMIPRLGMSQLERFKSNLIEEIRTSRYSKHQILCTGLWYLCCGNRRIRQLMDPNHLVIDPSSSDERPLISSSSSSHSYGSQSSSSSSSMPHHHHDTSLLPPGMMADELTIPGVIMHLERRGRVRRWWPRCGGRGEWYEVSWCDSTRFRDIRVSPNMWRDHFPDRMMNVLERVERDMEGDVFTVACL